MLASFPASMVNQKPADLGSQNQFNLTTSRFRRPHGERRMVGRYRRRRQVDTGLFQKRSFKRNDPSFGG